MRRMLVFVALTVAASVVLFATEHKTATAIIGSWKSPVESIGKDRYECTRVYSADHHFTVTIRRLNDDGAEIGTKSDWAGLYSVDRHGNVRNNWKWGKPASANRNIALIGSLRIRSSFESPTCLPSAIRGQIDQ